MSPKATRVQVVLLVTITAMLVGACTPTRTKESVAASPESSLAGSLARPTPSALRSVTPTTTAAPDPTPTTDWARAAPATETAIFATLTADAQAPEAEYEEVLPATPMTLAGITGEWAAYDLSEWGLALSLPAGWENSRMPGGMFFKPPSGGNFELTVGFQGNAPAELGALTDMLTDDWPSRTPLEFYSTPIMAGGVTSVAFWNTSPYVCADVYIPADGVVRAISFGASFCNEAHDHLNEVGQKVLESVELYPPG